MDVFGVAGVSQGGKTTLVEKLIQIDSQFVRPVTGTTRDPEEKKEGGMEIHGEDYFFYTFEEFKRLEAEGFFVETAPVHGEDKRGNQIWYGTPKTSLERQEGKTLLWIADYKGMQNAFNQGLLGGAVFLVPFNYVGYEVRLSSGVSRRSKHEGPLSEEAREEILKSYQTRLATAEEEVKYLFDKKCLFKYVIDTSKSESQSLRELRTIIAHEINGAYPATVEGLTLEKFRERFNTFDEWFKSGRF